ncbi:MAG: DUF4325 domain-containing protein [bacterium]
MLIELKKFGKVLSSRPSGKEAYMSAKAYILPQENSDDTLIEIDFNGVDVLSPSWADEFLTPIAEEARNRVKLLHCKNPTVISTLELLGLEKLVD